MRVRRSRQDDTDNINGTFGEIYDFDEDNCYPIFVFNGKFAYGGKIYGAHGDFARLNFPESQAA